MFTGLVEHLGTVASLTRKGGFVELTVESPYRAEELTIGESIAVDGYCQTVVRAEGNRFTVEVSPETLARTTAGHLKVGAKVNLERALAVGDRLGGHIVAGHVDGVGTITVRREEARFWLVAVRIRPRFRAT